MSETAQRLESPPRKRRKYSNQKANRPKTGITSAKSGENLYISLLGTHVKVYTATAGRVNDTRQGVNEMDTPNLQVRWHPKTGHHNQLQVMR